MLSLLFENWKVNLVFLSLISRMKSEMKMPRDRDREVKCSKNSRELSRNETLAGYWPVCRFDMGFPYSLHSKLPYMQWTIIFQMSWWYTSIFDCLVGLQKRENKTLIYGLVLAQSEIKTNRRWRISAHTPFSCLLPLDRTWEGTDSSCRSWSGELEKMRKAQVKDIIKKERLHKLALYTSSQETRRCFRSIKQTEQIVLHHQQWQIIM